MIDDPEKYKEHFKGNDALFDVFKNLCETMPKTSDEMRRLIKDMQNVAHFKAKERI